MFGSLRLMMVPLMAASFLAVASGSAEAAKAPPAPGTTGVQDNARMFSKEAVQKAESRIKDLVRDYRRGVLIETMKEVPAKFADRAAEAKTRRAAFQEMAAAAYKREKVGGAYLLISTSPKTIQAEIGNTARDDGFNGSRRDAWVEAVTAKLKAGDNDAALAAAVDQVEEVFKSIGPAKAAVSAQPPQGARHAASSNEPLSLTAWIIIGVVAIVVVWLVVGLLRAFSGMGGGGGGGFMSGLMGGLFGAVAGMWLYNSFMGGNSAWGGNAYGNDGATGSGEEGSTGGGGDYGNDAGGDAGGGGDWGGGGGGDWGGGGGGDWGGGGGGGDW